MERIVKNIFFSLRLIAALLLLSCLSPVPEAPGDKPTTFASLVSSTAGPLRLVIWKSQYTLTLYKGDRPVRTYHAVFGKGFRDGDKRMMGDKRTPEGEFYICTMNHSKRFYKFMGLSYPGLKHAEYGLQSRTISPVEYTMIKKAIEERQSPPWDTRLGGAVGIHGRMLDNTGASHFYSVMNWTDGCIALDNADVDEIYSVVSLGTPVTILP
ncbi:MAG TPA: L,D-transpeptidase [Nitrospirota bacterium]|nr:L,D-transpeptidase [Nitrospirota bacterium]